MFVLSPLLQYPPSLHLRVLSGRAMVGGWKRVEQIKDDGFPGIFAFGGRFLGLGNQ